MKLWTLKKNIEHGSKTLNSDHKSSHRDKLQKLNPPQQGEEERIWQEELTCFEKITCSNLIVKAWATVWFFAAKKPLLSTAMPEDTCRQPQEHPKRNSTGGTTVAAPNS